MRPEPHGLQEIQHALVSSINKKNQIDSKITHIPFADHGAQGPAGLGQAEGVGQRQGGQDQIPPQRPRQHPQRPRVGMTA
jgi:hypothetical protein